MYKNWASSLVPILSHTSFSPHSCKTKAGQEGLGIRDIHHIITMMHVVCYSKAVIIILCTYIEEEFGSVQP